MASEHEHDAGAVVARAACDLALAHGLFDPALWRDIVRDTFAALQPGDRLPGVDENGQAITLVVVPEEPSEAMHVAALNCWHGKADDPPIWLAVYRAMLAASGDT